jgi:hypothetical protein
VNDEDRKFALGAHATQGLQAERAGVRRGGGNGARALPREQVREIAGRARSTLEGANRRYSRFARSAVSASFANSPCLAAAEVFGESTANSRSGSGRFKHLKRSLFPGLEPLSFLPPSSRA